VSGLVNRFAPPEKTYFIAKQHIECQKVSAGFGMHQNSAAHLRFRTIMNMYWFASLSPCISRPSTPLIFSSLYFLTPTSFDHPSNFTTTNQLFNVFLHVQQHQSYRYLWWEFHNGGPHGEYTVSNLRSTLIRLDRKRTLNVCAHPTRLTTELLSETWP